MRKTALLGAVMGLSLAASPAVIAEDETGSDSAAEIEMTKGEKKLAKLIEGRVAGEPVRCIRSMPNDRLTVIDDTAYVYGRGKTIYVQKTRHPDRIDRDDVLVQRRFSSSQLCRLDVVTAVDRFSGIFSGPIFFDDFVPYTRVEKGEQAS